MNPEYISAISNVVMAVGVVFAAGQFYVSKREQTAQLEAHIVELHTHFQQQIRELQKSFPPTANRSKWKPENDQQKRAVRLYWYLVFDEWLTCQYLSKEKRLNDLWGYYRYGVISALQKQCFDEEVKRMFKEKPVFFGLAQEFEAEINKLRKEAVRTG